MYTLLLLLSYPIYGLRAVTNINDFSNNSCIFSLFGSIPMTQFLVKDTQESLINLNERSTFDMITGLNTFN